MSTVTVSPRQAPPGVAPHPIGLATALAVGRDSPCAKSQRGAAVYHPRWFAGVDDPVRMFGTGHNGVPMGACTGTAACRAACGRVCVHAEVRAIRETVDLLARTSYGEDARRRMLGQMELVHVKVGEDGQVAPGGGPSCWQCSREIVDVGIGLVWLYEHAEALVVEQAESIDGPVIRRYEGIGTWRGYDGPTFHRLTLRNCEIDGPAL